jgi:hypothetical protein
LVPRFMCEDRGEFKTETAGAALDRGAWACVLQCGRARREGGGAQ